MNVSFQDVSWCSCSLFRSFNYKYRLGRNDRTTWRPCCPWWGVRRRVRGPHSGAPGSGAPGAGCGTVWGSAWSPSGDCLCSLPLQRVGYHCRDRNKHTAAHLCSLEIVVEVFPTWKKQMLWEPGTWLRSTAHIFNTTELHSFYWCLKWELQNGLFQKWELVELQYFMEDCKLQDKSGSLWVAVQKWWEKHFEVIKVQAK